MARRKSGKVLFLGLGLLLLVSGSALAQHRGSELLKGDADQGSDLVAQAITAATAQGVALNSGADCTTNADLDVTFTATNVDREFGQTSLTDGTILDFFEQSSGFTGFSGTFVGYGQPITPQPPNTLIGSYAYIGFTPPDAQTAEFFILYDCTTQQVLFSCFGQYPGCPQTADEVPQIPATPRAAMLILLVLLTLIGLSAVQGSIFRST